MKKSIYDLSWGESSFWAKLQLFFRVQKKQRENKCSLDSCQLAFGYSTLSSTYYSIAGTALVHSKRFPQVLWWLPLGLWCYWRMLSLSDKAVALIGYEKMTADMYDVRQSILRRRGRFDEAVRCISIALGKPASLHTKGLLWVGLADIHCKKGNRQFARDCLLMALDYAKKSETTDPRQAARIYKHCAVVSDWLEKSSGARLRKKAEELAQQTGAKDQILKIKS